MRDAGGHLLRALVALAGGEDRARCTAMRSVAWASATFVGARHECTLLLSGADAEARADAIAAGIGTTEFALPGHLVADAVLVERRTTAAGIELALEALTVEEA